MIDTDERSRVRENNPLPAFRIEYTINEEKKEKRSNNIIPSTIIAKHETRLVSVNKYDNERLLKHLEKYPSHLRTIICYVSFVRFLCSIKNDIRYTEPASIQDRHLLRTTIIYLSPLMTIERPIERSWCRSPISYQLLTLLPFISIWMGQSITRSILSFSLAPSPSLLLLLFLPVTSELQSSPISGVL